MGYDQLFAVILLADRIKEGFALVCGEQERLGGTTADIEAVNAFVNQSAHLSPEHLVVDLAGFVIRSEQRSADTFKFLHEIHPFFNQTVRKSRRRTVKIRYY